MSDPNIYTVGWICALPKELVAAKAFLDEEHQRPSHVAKNNTHTYSLGSMEGHNVVIAASPMGEYGTASAAAVARDMLHSFPNVRVGLMVGIGGGAPSDEHDIRLGDVVVSTPQGAIGGVFQYDFGKTIQDQAFRHTRFLDQPPTLLRAAMTTLESRHDAGGCQFGEAISRALSKSNGLLLRYRRPGPSSDRLFRSDVVHPPAAASCAEGCLDDPSNMVARGERAAADDNPAIHYGIIASGNQVMKDAIIRDRLAAERDVLCFEMEAAGLMNHFPCLVIRGICDYSDSHKNDEWQGYAAMAAAAYASALLHEVVPSQVDEVERICKLLANLHDGIARVDGKIDAITDCLSTESCVAGSAAFNSYDESHNSTCLPGTRVELIQQILSWAGGDEDGKKPIFWLNGMLGTGKSTVSRTIAQSLHQAGRLGASFFFKRGHSDRQSAAKFFTTIAHQLVRMQPALAHLVRHAIRADPSIGSSGVQNQFNQLIRGPLSALPQDGWRNAQVVIVVDALDECGQPDDAADILRLLSTAKPWLRVFVTSRPEFPIHRGFSNIEGQFQNVACHAIPHSVMKQDILVLITHRLNEIRDRFNRSKRRRAPLDGSWPRQDDIDTLAEMATPLFIYAAIICNAIDDIKCGYPNTQLRKVLGWKAESSKTSPETKLDKAYLLLLEQLLTNVVDAERDAFLQEFRCIVGSIVLLGSPLSIPVLAELLGLPIETVDIRLDMLHSVLDVPPSDESPVRLLHASFRDFLVRETKKKHAFWIDEAKTHGAIAARCLHVITQHFEPDSQPSGGEVSMIDREEADANEEVQLAAVRYACLHWVFHLQGAQADSPDSYKVVLSFLENHFLRWLEALSEMRQVPEGIKMLKALQALPQMNANSELPAFVDDALRILRANLQIIINEPRQLYSSVILFAPEESIIKKLFMGSMSMQIVPKPKVESHWNHCIQALEGHTGPVLCVAFSHDSLRVASASEDHTVRVWSIDTGEVKILNGHSGPVHAVAFSHDSLRLASGAGDSTVRVWCTESGKCVRTLDSGGERVESVAFSYDSALIASVSRCGVVSVWRADDGEPMKEYGVLNFDPLAANSVAFSCSEHTSKVILKTALALYTGSIKQLRSGDRSGEDTHTLDGHEQLVKCMAFSHDASLLASASADQTVRVWNTETGNTIQEYTGHMSPGIVTAIAFSHDSSLIAFASDDCTIRLHCTQTMTCAREFKCHGHELTSVDFSHDSSMIASASNDHTIRLWRTGLHLGSARHYNKAIGEEAAAETSGVSGHRSRVVAVAFSQDSLLMASLSNGRTVRIWRTDTGECVRRFAARAGPDASSRQEPRPVGCLTFSHDSSYVAFSLQEETVRIWSVGASEFVHELKGHQGCVSSIAFSHDSSLAASTSGGQIRLWHVETGHEYPTLRSLDRGETRWREPLFNAVTFSPDSLHVAAASTAGLQVWRIKTRECVHILGGSRHRFDLVAFSHDASTVASASDGRIQLWEVATGRCLQELCMGADVVISQMSFTPDDLHLLTNVGMFTWAENESTLRPDGRGFTDDFSWITHNGCKELWLPKDWRPTCSAVSSKSAVAIGCASGKIWIMASNL
ncbi:WD40 repeat-like protein [Trichoderma novae-zelandiae]